MKYSLSLHYKHKTRIKCGNAFAHTKKFGNAVPTSSVSRTTRESLGGTWNSRFKTEMGNCAWSFCWYSLQFFTALCKLLH